MTNDDQPRGRVARVAKVVADNLNLRKASRTIDEIVEEVAPRPESDEDGRSGRLQRLGDRIAFAGAVVAVVYLAVTGCKTTPAPAPSGPAPSAHASCEEPASWCHPAALAVVGR